MTNPTPINYANLLSVRSTVGNPAQLPPNMARLDLVLNQNRLENFQTVGPLKRILLPKNTPLFTFVQGQQTLVFKHHFTTSGYEVNTSLRMIIEPHDFRRLINTFYIGSSARFISTGLVMRELDAAVSTAVSQNLAIIPLGAWLESKRGVPVKSATRHDTLVQACSRIGFKLFYDELQVDVRARTA